MQNLVQVTVILWQGDANAGCGRDLNTFMVYRLRQGSYESFGRVFDDAALRSSASASDQFGLASLVSNPGGSWGLIIAAGIDETTDSSCEYLCDAHP